MPKMKSVRSAVKRFKRTGNGALKRRRAYRAHILTKKSTKAKRHKRSQVHVGKSDMAAAVRMIDV